MEAVYFQFHSRSTRAVARCVPRPVRLFIGAGLFVGTIVILGFLSALHQVHVQPRDGGCLRDLLAEYHGPVGKPAFQVLHVTVIPPPSNELAEGLRNILDFSGWPPKGESCPESSLRELPLGASPPGAAAAQPSALWAAFTGAPHPSAPASFSFSLEKAWLLLPEAALASAGVRARHVAVRADDERCFGGHPALRAPLHLALGYDSVLASWCAALGGGRGFLRAGPAPAEGGPEPRLAELRSTFAPPQAEPGRAAEGDGRSSIPAAAGSAARVGLSSLLVFVVTTTLVSFTLRETQERVLKFTFLLHHHVRHHLGFAALITSHLVDSLAYLPIMVAAFFFLERFLQTSTGVAYFVLALVWLGEVFTAVCVRAPASRRLFPRLFFLVFTMLQGYLVAWPCGFAPLALAAAFGAFFLTCLAVWDCCEVPALLVDGTVTALHPRGASNPAVAPTLSLRALCTPPAVTPPPGSPARPSRRASAVPPPAAASAPPSPGRHDPGQGLSPGLAAAPSQQLSPQENEPDPWD